VNNTRTLSIKIVWLVTVFILSGCSTLQAPPGVKGYCKSISGADNMNSAGTRVCMDQEMSAKKKLSRMTIPWKVEKYCREISEQTGGSYQVMLICVEEEQEY